MEARVINEIMDTVDRLGDDITETLRQLVRIPSIVGHEGPAQAYLSEQYENLGLEVTALEANRDKLKNHPAFIDSGLGFDGRPNLIGKLPGHPGKKSIILNGHVDVVSPEPVDQWRRDPWGAEIEDNRLYGRGAMDMKAGLVANLYALKALMEAGLKPGGDVLLQSVVEEEAGGGGGTLACLIEGHTADGMIISEPHPVVCISHTGVLYFRVKVKGRTAHAGRAHTGVNAIGKMLKIYQALADLDAHRQATVRYPLYQADGSPACHLNPGRLTAGDWPSTVAGFAELECRISFIPGETEAQMHRLIEDTVSEVVRTDPWLQEHPPEIAWFGWHAEPWYQDPGDPFVKMALENHERVTGVRTDVKGLSAGLDTRFAAFFGFPSLALGPTGDFPHGYDEYVDLDSVIRATKTLALATLDWCSRDK